MIRTNIILAKKELTEEDINGIMAIKNYLISITKGDVYMNSSVSPSRTYVACCLRLTGGYYFRKFVLPEIYNNHSYEANWYFLNKLDSFACLQGCYTAEDFADITEVIENG